MVVLLSQEWALTATLLQSSQGSQEEWVLGQQHHQDMQKLEEELQERGEPMDQQLNFQAPRNKDGPFLQVQITQHIKDVFVALHIQSANPSERAFKEDHIQFLNRQAVLGTDLYPQYYKTYKLKVSIGMHPYIYLHVGGILHK